MNKSIDHKDYLQRAITLGTLCVLVVAATLGLLLGLVVEIIIK
jgi:hypothetical protein